jgi:hypothetical protein
MKASRAARFAPGLGPAKQRCFSNEEGSSRTRMIRQQLRVMWAAE